jgi:hypothetical protein
VSLVATQSTAHRATVCSARTGPNIETYPAALVKTYCPAFSTAQQQTHSNSNSEAVWTTKCPALKEAHVPTYWSSNGAAYCSAPKSPHKLSFEATDGVSDCSACQSSDRNTYGAAYKPAHIESDSTDRTTDSPAQQSTVFTTNEEPNYGCVQNSSIQPADIDAIL